MTEKGSSQFQANLKQLKVNELKQKPIASGNFHNNYFFAPNAARMEMKLSTHLSTHFYHSIPKLDYMFVKN